MGEKNLVICDSEIQYANNLMENISERKEIAVKVYTCTTLERVMAFSKEKKIDIFIVDDRCSEKERSEIEAGQTFVLTTGLGSGTYEGEKTVYKYQNADRILEEIFQVYLEHTKEELVKTVKKGYQKIFAVYSPVHRSGKTRFSVAFGRELARKRETLYINLEEYPGFGERFQREEGKNLGDLIYYTKQENGNIGIRIGMMVKHIDELAYIPPIPVCSDLKEITWEEWRGLLQQISESSIYEIILLDIGESIQGLFSLLQLCDHIYMPVLEDSISQEKMRQYEENLSLLGLEALKEKTSCFVAAEDVGEDAKRMATEEIA